MIGLWSEAASLMLRSFPAAKSWMQRQSKKRGKKKAHATGNNESAGKR